MNLRFAPVALVGATLVSVAGCVATPPRTTYSYDDNYYQRRAVYDCAHRCGVVRDVDRVYVRDNATTGGGAVLGAIIGGVLGSTIGKGDGRTAATVGGAVAGGFAGNAVERNSNEGGGREAWQFHVKLDDGRWATVTQWDSGGLRPGDRVMIRDNRLMLLR
ncbi:MAG TPA: glycine zipper 2TM domain-containing protein [Dokdonella sp.]